MLGREGGMRLGLRFGDGFEDEVDGTDDVQVDHGPPGGAFRAECL